MTPPTSPEKSAVSVSVITPDLNGESKFVAGTIGGGDEPLQEHTQEACQVYKFRWVVLILFVVYSMSNAFQWIQFAIINGLIGQFYGVSEGIVDMTSVIYMITYIPLIFPAMYFLDKYGLRKAVLIGSAGTALGSWIKVFSASPSLFPVAFIGQTVVAVSQIFILGIPPLLAAVWFGPDQVSTATSIGVFGNQLGVAAGFVLPPMLVKNGTQEEMGHDLQVMFIGTGCITAALFVAVVVLFRDKPPTPPSMAQMALLTAEKEPYVNSIKRLFTNKGYLLLLASYGMNVGVFYAISTVLSSFILKYHPGKDEDTGRIGFMIVLFGMLGSIISGFVLDKTRKFKETTLVIYFLSFTGMLVYTFALPNANHIAWMYVVFASLGFFMTGYLPVGFEFAAEITYPESEGTSAGLLNASAQVFGIILTTVSRLVFESPVGDLGANLLLASILLIGVIMTALIKADLRRTTAQRASVFSPTSFDNPNPMSPDA